ncbi:MAG: type IV toxin-antitoxin system AbiEi family antitoxin domain-containing protein [Actinomycetes bacterium]
MARPRRQTDALLRALPAAFTRQEALASGMSAALLDRLTSEGSVERFAHGLYVNERDGPVDLDLAEVRLRSPLATICLTSALARHGLIDEIPARIDLAVPRGSHLPVLRPPAAWHKYDPDTFDIGRHTETFARGLLIGVYDAERSIVDAFNPRLGLPRGQAIEALRVWLRRTGTQPASLLRIAQHWPHARAGLIEVLQVLL